MKKGYALLGLFMSLVMSSCGTSGGTNSSSSHKEDSSQPSIISSSPSSSRAPSSSTNPSSTSEKPPFFGRLTKVASPEGFNHDVYGFRNKYYAFYQEWLYNFDAQKKAESLGGNIYFDSSYAFEDLVEEFAGIKVFDWDTIGYIQLGSFKKGNDFYTFNGSKIDLTSYSPVDVSSGEKRQLVYGWYTRGGSGYKNYDYMYLKYYACTYIIEWDNYSDIGIPKESGYLTKKITNQAELIDTSYIDQSDLYLANDITLDDSFTYIDNFKYALDGRGHTIRIRSKNATAEDKYNFIKTLSGSIKNTKFEIEIESEEEFAGLAGLIDTNNGALENVEISGSINTPNVSDVSGLVSSNNGTLKDITIKVDITGKNNVGGLAGNAAFGGTISNVTSEGNIIGKDNVGGIFGNIANNVDTSLSKLTNKGEITGESYVGGLIGKMNLSGNNLLNAQELVNDANVTGTKYVGGVIGYGQTNNNESHIDKSSSISTTITGGSYSGVIAGCLNNVILNKPVNTDSVLVIDEYDLDEKGYKISYVGGVVGKGYSVIDALNEVDVYAEGKYVGGISGYLDGYLNSCSNAGNIESAADYIGGIAGYLDHKAKDKELTNSLTTLSNDGDIIGANYVGGLVGYYNHNDNIKTTTAISNCYNFGEIIGKNYVSGLFGYSSCPFGISVSKSTNNGDITGTSHLGGLFGYCSTNDVNSRINQSDCLNATITGETTYIGSIAGELVNVIVDNCKNDGTQIVVSDVDIDASGNPISYVGGFVGKGYKFNNLVNKVEVVALGAYVGGIAGYATGDITECSNDADVYSENDYIGGLVGYVSESYNFTENTNNGDVTGRYYVGGNFGYVISTGTTNYDAIYNKLNNEGDITGKNYVGGVAGFVKHDPSKNNATLKGTRLTNNGSIVITSDDGKVGGIFAYAFTDGTNSYVTLCSNSDSNVSSYGELINIVDRDAE